jgi:hypothetical protein
VLTLVSPEHMERRLDTARAWLLRNGVLLTALAMIAIGVVITYAGVANV